MLSDYQDKPKCMITGDETWIYAYDPETTDQSSEYRSKGEHVKVVQKSKSWWQFFSDFRGVVHYEFLPPLQTVNKQYYLSVMRRLREEIRLKRPELWANNSWFLHHDNAPSYTALVLPVHFVKKSTHIVSQPLYLPELAPCDLWLFPKLKRPLRWTRFESIDKIKAESKKALLAIPEKDYLACF